MIFRYVRRRLLRNLWQTLILIALGGIFAVMLLKLNSYLALQVENRQEMLPNIPIRCVVTDRRGEKTEGLSISAYVIDYLTWEESQLFQHVDKLCIKTVMVFEIPCLARYPQLLEELKIKDRSMVALTRLEAERRLDQVHGVKITYLPGYDEQCFQETTGYFCLLPQDLYNIIVEKEETIDGLPPSDTQQIDNIAVNLLLDTYQSGLATVACDMQVAGYYQGGNRDIYCNWQAALDGYAQIEERCDADSLSFILRDNSRLDEFKDVASNYFVERSISPGLGRYSLTIHDQQYNAMLYSIDRNIKMLQTVLPLLNILTIGIGFFVSYVFIRNRKHEFALMASLGTGKKKVFLLVFFELALLIITGITLGTVFYMIIENQSAIENVLVNFVFFLCFMVGAAVAIVRILSTNVISMLSRE